jgi:pimeloyl-ACP methyl ester carboxylesterase
MNDAGSALAHYTVGEGPQGGVLLHGFLGSGKNLRSLAQRWVVAQPELRLVIPDLRGHGGSPPLAPDTDLPAMAEDVLATATAARLPEPFIVVGHSLGGRVALAAAERAPARLAGVVLLDMGPGPIDPASTGTARVLSILLAAPEQAPDRRTMRAALLEAGLSAPTTDWLLMNLVADPGGSYRWRFDRQALAALHERFCRADLWPVIEARPVPIRCIRGGRSRQVSDAEADRLRAAGCAVDTIADAGHDVHVEAPEELIGLLQASA